MNGWVSMLFTIVGGIMLLMKNKTNENGGGGYTVVNDNTPAPSPSEENVSAEIDSKNVTVNDVLDDPSILDILKITDRDKYESLTRSIWNSDELLAQYTGKQSGSFENKENEVVRLLEEGFKAEYVGISTTGNYWIEVFTKYDSNVGWNGDEKVGVTLYEILFNYPNGRTNKYKRGWELATAVNLEHPVWNSDIASFEQSIKNL